jgi:hypothetical protein
LHYFIKSVQWRYSFRGNAFHSYGSYIPPPAAWWTGMHWRHQGGGYWMVCRCLSSLAHPCASE